MNDAAVDVDFEAPDAWVRMAQKFSAQDDGGRNRKAGGGGYKTLSAIENGGWWRLRGRLSPLIGAASSARAAIRALSLRDGDLV